MDNRKNTEEINLDSNTRRITWGAIIAGALIMMVIVLLLSLLGAGIGLGTIRPASEQQPMQGLGTGAIIWWVLSNLIAVFVGGYVAGKLTNIDFKVSGLLHGVLAWSLYTLISFFVLSTTVGAVVNGVGSMVTKSVSTLGSGVGSLIKGGQNQNMDLQGAIDKALGGQKGDSIVNSRDLVNIAKDLFFKDGKFNTNVSRQDLENSIANNTKLSEDQIRQVSDELYKIYQQSMSQMQNLKEQTENADKNASRAAIWSFIALLIGAGLSALGGNVGGMREDITA